MTEPIVRIPWRLTVDLSMIVLAAILIGIGIRWQNPRRQFSIRSTKERIFPPGMVMSDMVPLC
jgi:hypothetical protein